MHTTEVIRKSISTPAEGVDFELQLRDMILPYSRLLVDRTIERLSDQFPEGTDPLYNHTVLGSGGWDDEWTIPKIRTMRDDIPDPEDFSKNNPRIVKGAKFVRLLKMDELPQLELLGDSLRLYGKRPKDAGFLRFMLRSVSLVDPGLANAYENEYCFNPDAPFGLFDEEQKIMTCTNRRTPLVCAQIARASLASLERPKEPDLTELPAMLRGIAAAAFASKVLPDAYSPMRLKLHARIHGQPSIPAAHLVSPETKHAV